MKIHLYQNDIEWENPEENIIRANKSLGEIDISSGDLVILPEMFSTGFSMRSELCIEMEEEKNKTLHFLQRLAILNSCCVIAGVTTKINENFFNESLALLPNKKIISYRKNYLFSPAKEHMTFTAGDEIKTFEWNQWVIGMSICYDLRFPELYRELAAKRTNLMVNIANWPLDRIEHWITLLKARAIENQSFIVGVNRTGTDPNSTYNGNSMIIDPMGKVVLDAGENPGVYGSTIEIETVNSWRKSFPAVSNMRKIKSR